MSENMGWAPTELELMERSIFWSFELREGRVASVLFQGIQCERERERERPSICSSDTNTIDWIGEREARKRANGQARELIGMSTAESSA